MIHVSISLVRSVATTAALVAILGSTLSAREPAARLVSFAELEKRLADPNLRILDARPKPAYEKGHIPGAIRIDAKEIEASAAKPGALVDRALWEKIVAPLGIDAKTEVLVYDASRQLDAARVWWLLGYLGVEKVGLIDGDFPLWLAEKRPVTTDVPKVQPKPFRVSFQTDRHATREEVLSALDSDSILIVDARSPGEYVGEDKRAKRFGHVPSACSLEWSDLVDKNGRFLEESVARAKFVKAGVKPGAPVITHCQGGGRASVNAFVLERLGYPTRNYYLGWSDWGNQADTPIRIGETPGSRR